MKGGRVGVCEDLSVPGHPGIFVIGDAAHVEHEGRRAPRRRAGREAAGRLRREGHQLARGRTSGARPFRYRDKGNLATVGRSFAVVDLPRVRFSGLFAWLTWLAVHIVYLIGFRNRMLVLIEWAWSYFTFQRSARIISREDD